MRRILMRTALGIAVLAVPMAAVAGISLSSTMESWSHNKRAIDAMLAGRIPYDEAQLRQIFRRYVESSSMVARTITGQSAQARDLATRFEAFSNDSAIALGAVRQPAAMATRFNQMLGDCQSCHDAYNN
jgi:cytochrome c556